MIGTIISTQEDILKGQEDAFNQCSMQLRMYLELLDTFDRPAAIVRFGLQDAILVFMERLGTSLRSVTHNTKALDVLLNERSWALEAAYDAKNETE